MSGGGVPKAILWRQNLLFGKARDAYIKELARGGGDTRDSDGTVVDRFFFAPDVEEDQLPDATQWSNRNFVPDDSTAGKRFYDLRDSVIDFRGSAALPVNINRDGPPVLLYRRNSNGGYGLTLRQQTVSAQVLLRTLDESVSSGFSFAPRVFGGFYAPFVADFKKVASTGQSTATSNMTVLSLHGFAEGREPTETEKAATLERLKELNRDLQSGSFGAVYRGVPYGDVGWSRSVAIRVQGIRPTVANQRNGLDKWLHDARLMLYVCHIFEEYRVSRPQLNNFCPKFYQGLIGVDRSVGPESHRVVTVHAYWDGTLDRAILFNGRPVVQAILAETNPARKKSLVLAEFARIWKVLDQLDAFAFRMLAIWNGDVGGVRIIHGDLKMNNVVFVGDDYVMGVIDFGMTSFYNKEGTGNGNPPQRVMAPENFRYNTPPFFDGGFDLSYLRYTTRAQLMLWLEQMHPVVARLDSPGVELQQLATIAQHVPFLHLLGLPVYTYYLETYAAQKGSGWIYPQGTEMSRYNPQTKKTRTHEIRTPLEALTPIRPAKNGFYECEIALVSYKIALAGPDRQPTQAAIEAMKLPKTRWDIFQIMIRDQLRGTR